MNSIINKQNITSTSSTIQDSKVQIVSSRFILPSTLKLCQQVEQKNSPQRAISILEENIINSTHQIQIIEENVVQYLPRRRNIKINGAFQWKKYSLEIANVLQMIFFKKKRYCFQVLKQFILFPDETYSQVSSLSLYDPLIFREEIIHSLVKILQTRLVSNEMWGFINLKMYPFLKAANKIAQKTITIHEKVMRVQKKCSFDLIKKASDDFISLISKDSRCFYINNNLQTENKQVQCITQERRSKYNKSLLSSNIVQQKIVPVIRIKPQTIQTQSTTRVYTRQEYEKKYGQTASERQDYQPKVIRFEAHDYSQRRIEQQPSIKETVREVQTKVRVQKQNISDKSNIKKYNIIHYHERPRQIIHSVSTYHENQKNNVSCRDCCISSCNLCCCCQHEEIHSCGYRYSRSELRSCLYSNHNCKFDKINQTAITQKSKHVNLVQSSFISKNMNSQVENYQLSQLSSRIQYLNFLKNLVREQQEQQKF